MQNIIFKCNSQEKNQFMVHAEKAGLGASVVLRNLVHLYLTDLDVMHKALTFAATIDKGEKENEEI